MIVTTGDGTTGQGKGSVGLGHGKFLGSGGGNVRALSLACRLPGPSRPEGGA